MGKLVHLLKERISTDNIINIVDAKKETSVGVLFRLMLAINNDHNFYNDVNSKSFVNKNLSTLEDTQTVKNLNMIFNKIMLILKDGKKVTIEMKKAYYSHVFTLLLPFAGKNDKIPPFGSLVTSFSSSKPDAISKQRQISIILGKALISNNDKLDNDDKMTIKAYISGLEEIDNKVTETPIVPKKTLEEKIEKMTTEDILATDDKLASNTIINNHDNDVTNINGDIEKIKHELDDTLVDAHTFSRIKMGQIEAPKEVEDKIIEITDKIVDTITKLPITHLPEDKVKRIQKIAAMISSDTMTVMVQYVPNIIGSDTIPLVSFDPDNNSVIVGFENPHGLRFIREFKLDKEGNITSVYHEYFELPESAQGTGISKDAMLAMLKTYKAAGIKKIDLHANLGMGGYVFLRYGFLPDDKSGNDIKDAFKGLKVGIENGLNPNKQAIGTNASNSLNALAKHFNTPEIMVEIKNALDTYNLIQEEINNFLISVEYDKEDQYTPIPVTMITKSEFIAEMFQSLISDVEKKFVINYETLDSDISSQIIDATFVTPKLKLEFNLPKTFNRDPNKVKAKTELELILKKSVEKSIKVKVSVKTILTIPGIIQTNDKGQMVNAFPPVETEVNGEYLVSALNWKGSLDLTNDTQFNKAISYATFKK